MFHDPQHGRDASKVALLRLVEELRARPDHTALLDVQWLTDHLASLGATRISRRGYLRRLAAALERPDTQWPVPSESTEEGPRRARPRSRRCARSWTSGCRAASSPASSSPPSAPSRPTNPAPKPWIGLEISAVTRHGKFCDIDAQGIHLVFHLARAGWLVWRDQLPETPARPGKGPLSLRVGLDDGSGFDLTEAGTQRKLAVYVVTDPADGARRRSVGSGPDGRQPQPSSSLDDDPARRRQGAAQGVLRDQKVIAGIGNAYSDEILHAAKLSPFRPASNLDRAGAGGAVRGRRPELREATERARGLAAKEIKDDQRRPICAVHGRTGEPCHVCGGNDRRGELRRLVAAVLPCLPDGRQGAG